MKQSASGGAPALSRRALGRRRRRLYATVVMLLIAGLIGSGIGWWVYRSTRPETYRTGEQHAEITRRLELRLPAGAPEPRLVDVTAAAGLEGFRSFAGTRGSQLPEDMGPGAAWGDFDDDGDDDLFVVSQGGPLGAPAADLARSRLYENRGDGTFEEFAAFPETRILGMGAAWADYDGDGRLDLIVTGYGRLLLFHNDGDGFSRDPALADRDGFWAGASWADYDRDGDLDLYVCGYVRYDADPGAPTRTTQQYGRAVPYTLNPASFRPERNLLFRNDGRGGFDEVAEELGVSNPTGRSLGALWWDLDDDGWPELYVANDISDNALYHNREGRFEDISHAAWVADYRGAMGLAAGDWNRDGDDDLFVTHWIAQENALYDSLWTQPAGESGEAPRGLRFMDVADQRGLGQIALQRIGWGTEFADLDGDGWLDLVVANGSTFETDEQPKQLRPEPSFLFWNERGQAFHDLAPLNESLSSERVSRGLALSDYDNDGDLDVLLVDRDAGVRLLRNDMQTGNWIELRLRREGPVEGTRIIAEVGQARLRRTLSGVSYLSQSTRTLHLGLGTAKRVDRLEVRWPGGGQDVHTDLYAGAIWKLTQGGRTPSRVAGGAVVPTEPDKIRTELSREQLSAFWRAQRAAMNAMKVDQDCPRAIGLFREALALDAEHEDSIYYLGNCLVETGEMEAGLESFERLMRLNPLSHRAHKRWGTLTAMRARTPEELEAASAVLERAVEINPEETGVMLALGELALLQGDEATARQRLDWVVRSNPDAGEAWFMLAYLEWRSGDGAGAERLLDRIREARREEWRPAGVAAEGDVRKTMHTEQTPLGEFYRAWPGTGSPERVFAGLVVRLGH